MSPYSCFLSRIWTLWSGASGNVQYVQCVLSSPFQIMILLHVCIASLPNSCVICELVLLIALYDQGILQAQA